MFQLGWFQAQRLLHRGHAWARVWLQPLPGLCSWVALTAHVLLQGRHLQPRRTTLEPYAPMVTDAPALVQTTLRTGEPPCARSRPYLDMSKPLPRFPERLRAILHGTA